MATKEDVRIRFKCICGRGVGASCDTQNVDCRLCTPLLFPFSFLLPFCFGVLILTPTQILSMGYGLSFWPIPIMATIQSEIAASFGTSTKYIWFIPAWTLAITVCFMLWFVYNSHLPRARVNLTQRCEYGPFGSSLVPRRGQSYLHCRPSRGGNIQERGRGHSRHG